MTLALTEKLETRHPLLLAPMAFVAGGRLAAAVSEAGGLGFIGGGYGDSKWLEQEFREAGDARVGVGFITWTLKRQPALLDEVLKQRPAAVWLSFGDPELYVQSIRSAGALLVCQVQTVEDALRAKAVGADVIVAQGTEAGGHGADRALSALLPDVADAVAPVPVVAAGGIADARGVQAALALGASGVAVGTRLFATQEALGHPNAKQALVEKTGADTVRSRVFDLIRGYDWPQPYTGRTLRNDFLERWLGREAQLEANLAEEQQHYQAAVAVGDTRTMVVSAGEGLDLIHDLPPAAEVVARLMEGVTPWLS